MIASCAVNSIRWCMALLIEIFYRSQVRWYEHDILNFNVFEVTNLVKFDQALF